MKASSLERLKLAGVGILTGVLVCLLGVEAWRDVARGREFRQAALQVEGRVTGFVTRPEGTAPSFEFQAEGELVATTGSDVLFLDRFEDGDAVAVLYPADEPHLARIDSPGQLYPRASQIGLVAVAFALVVGVVFPVVAFLRRKSKPAPPPE